MTKGFDIAGVRNLEIESTKERGGERDKDRGEKEWSETQSEGKRHRGK